jgi:hypothetical protein
LFPDFNAIPRTGAAIDALLEALDADSRLSGLANASGAGVFVRFSTGSGFRIERELLPYSLLGSAARRVVAKGRSTSELGPLLSEVTEVISRIRRLVAGKTDEGLALTAFEGLSLPHGARVETPWGTLRPAREHDEQLLMPLVGRPTAISAVLETGMPLKARLGEPPDGWDDFFDEESARVTTEAAERMHLTVLLTVGSKTRARTAWRTTANPLEAMAGGSLPGAGPLLPTPPAEVLDTHALGDLESWARRVRDHYHDSIGIAVRRTTSAVMERANADDALIDAVTAWENLFGHGGTGEVGFRVTSALAMLLEEDPHARMDFRANLLKIYGIRSKIVHGGELKAKDRVSERKEEATDIAVRALRKLFAEAPWLLEDRDRATRLILGTARES